MMRSVPFMLLLATATTITAQSPRPLAFEVVSIKVNASGDENWGFVPQPGGVMLGINVTARQIANYAYSMNHQPIEGGPEWVDRVHFDVTAKAAAAATQEQMLIMLRLLLADRFKLSVRTEARDTPVFALVRARADGRLGPQLRVSSVDCDAVRAAQARGVDTPSADGRPVCAGRARGGVITAGAVSMDEFARNMSGLAGRVVVNQTGLSGRYDLDLKFVPVANLGAAAGDRASELPSLFAALEEQLGLKLEPQRAPVNVMIIDSIQQPVEN